jgi:hypothetical protein
MVVVVLAVVDVVEGRDKYMLYCWNQQFDGPKIGRFLDRFHLR